MKQRLELLGVLDALDPSPSPESEAEGAAVLLNTIGTVMIDYLPSGCCGVPLASTEGSLTQFCKGHCYMDEDEGAIVCEDCSTPQGARYLRFAEGLFAIAIEDTEELGDEA